MGADDLERFVKRALRKGYSEERIKHQLRQQGWSNQEINDAIRAAKQGSGGAVILSVLFVVIIGIAAVSVWLVFAGDETSPPPAPNGSVENLSDMNDSEDPSQNTTNVSENESETSYVSECQRRQTEEKKFDCYASKMRRNTTSVDCRALPQPDRYLCTTAYEEVTMA